MIKLYHSPRSRSARIIWLLEELGVPYEVHLLQFPDGLKSADYLKVNPLGKVPSITDDGVTMFESGAIVEHLVEKHGKGKLAPAPGTPTRPLFLQWLHFGEATVMPPLSEIAQHTLFKPEAERSPSVIADAQMRAIAVLDTLETALAGKQYLVGNEFSAADVMNGYGLQLMKWFGLLTDRYPNVSAYFDRLSQRPAFAKAFG